MIAFLLAAENTPFAVSIAIMLIICALEVIGMMTGGSISELIEHMTEGHDSPHELSPEGHSSTLSTVLSWLRIGKVPFLVILVTFFTAFGVIGYGLQGIVSKLTGYMMPAALGWIPALAGALPMVRWTSGAIAAILPADETSAVSSSSFVGRMATISHGIAGRGKAAEARLKDAHGQTHYVMVEPDEADVTFEQGVSVLLVRQEGARFFAIANSNAHLEKE